MPDLADRNVEISDVTENFGPVPIEKPSLKFRSQKVPSLLSILIEN